jgi:hypothetical protein
LLKSRNAQHVLREQQAVFACEDQQAKGKCEQDANVHLLPGSDDRKA